MGMLEPVVLIPHLNEIRMLSIRSIKEVECEIFFISRKNKDSKE